MRIKLTVAYRGTAYAGWQIQPDATTVQGALQSVVQLISEAPAKVTGASRTDAGVHAAGQVCHFDSSRPLPPRRWQRAFNRILPDDIRVLEAVEVNDDFHARFGATSKTYRYHVDPEPIASPFLAPFCWHRPRIVALDAMRDAARHLEGDVCQRVFAARPEGDRDVRPIDSVTIEAARVLTFTVVGRSFLRHAVRGMIGSLLEVGYGRRSAAEIRAMAKGEEGHPPMVKAPAHGLVLALVRYGNEAAER